MSSRELSLIALLCVLAAAGLGSRGAISEPRSLADRPRQGGTLRLSQPAPNTLDPADLTTVYESSLVNQIFDGLVRWDLSLRPVPALAREWTIAPGGMEYRFRLHKGVRFHDGSLLEPADVVYSIERLLRLSRGQVSATLELLRSIEGARPFEAGQAARVSGLEVKDPDLVCVRLVRPEKALLSALATDKLKILPRKIVQRDPDGFGAAPVGTGPFRLLSWERGAKIVLEAFPGHFQGRPYLDRLVFDTDPDLKDGRETAAFLSGSLDVVQPGTKQLAVIQRSGRFPTLRRIEPNLFYLGFNLGQPPFHRPELRRAISRAVDRAALAKLLGPMVIPASGLIPTGVPGYVPAPRTDPYDPAAARELLQKAGPTERLPALEIWAYSSPERNRFVIESLRRLGLEAKLRNVSWEKLDSATTAGQAGAFFLGLVADLPEARSFLVDSFHSRGASNWYGYSNPKLDGLLDAAREEQDPERLGTLLRQAEALVLEDAPVVPLFHRVNLVAFQPRVKGLELNPFGLADAAYERVWLDGP